MQSFRYLDPPLNGYWYGLPKEKFISLIVQSYKRLFIMRSK